MTFAARVAALEASAPRWLPTAQVPDGTLVYGPAYASLVDVDIGTLPPPRVMNPQLRARYGGDRVRWLVGYCVPAIPAIAEAEEPQSMAAEIFQLKGS